ncbi:MAG: ornithine carbamoyltransferase [Myxococcales bacterium]|nr:MAG: ornithine carbamoyltransferase [Myxococcales bacterium]
MKHLLRDDDLTPAEQGTVLELAASLKAEPFSDQCLAGPHTVAMIFDKPTLRTQSSFAAGVAELGGHAMMLDGQLAGIGVRESVADVARVLGRQASVIVWRTFDQDNLAEMAEWAGVPVINALTDDFHPCQGLADLMTIRQHRGELAGLTHTFLGDAASNMGNSTMLAGALAGMHVRLSGPGGYLPDPEIVKQAQTLAATTGGSVEVVEDPRAAVEGADAVSTDTWVSMGKEDESFRRERVFADWQLDKRLLSLAANDALVLHCLPAYRGKEITARVLEGSQSVVWDQAENRRHVQKAVISHLLAGASS